jgi:hypothetical protein
LPVILSGHFVVSMALDTPLEKGSDRYVGSKRNPDAIQSGRETRIDDAAATPRERERVLPPGTMEVAVPVLITTWHAWRHHVDLCRTCAALCRG